MEIKLIPSQIKENRIYKRFCRKTRFSSNNKVRETVRETEDSIKLDISFVKDGSD